MAQHREVPAFGEWDAENVQYTAIFEKARKGRDPGAQRKMINPNDPQQNPYAAVSRPSREEGRSKGLRVDEDPKRRDGNPHPSELEPQRKARMGSAVYYTADGISSQHPHKRPGGHQRRGSGASSNGSSYSNISTPPHPQAARAAYVRHGDSHQRTSSVPQFGSWNERDPSSTEGYTMIFSKVKEERHGGVPVKQQRVSDDEHIDNDEKTPATTPSKLRFLQMCFCLAP